MTKKGALANNVNSINPEENRNDDNAYISLLYQQCYPGNIWQLDTFLLLIYWVLLLV